MLYPDKDFIWDVACIWNINVHVNAPNDADNTGEL